VSVWEKRVRVGRKPPKVRFIVNRLGHVGSEEFWVSPHCRVVCHCLNWPNGVVGVLGDGYCSHLSPYPHSDSLQFRVSKLKTATKAKYPLTKVGTGQWSEVVMEGDPRNAAERLGF
jgi:hypothetical protein